MYWLAIVAMGLGLPTRKKAWQQEDCDMTMKEKASYGPVSSLGFKPPVSMPKDTAAWLQEEQPAD